jgi:hypothetical protein
MQLGGPFAFLETEISTALILGSMHFLPPETGGVTGDGVAALVLESDWAYPPGD